MFRAEKNIIRQRLWTRGPRFPCVSESAGGGGGSYAPGGTTWAVDSPALSSSLRQVSTQCEWMAVEAPRCRDRWTPATNVEPRVRPSVRPVRLLSARNMRAAGEDYGRQTGKTRGGAVPENNPWSMKRAFHDGFRTSTARARRLVAAAPYRMASSDKANPIAVPSPLFVTWPAWLGC